MLNFFREPWRDEGKFINQKEITIKEGGHKTKPSKESAILSQFDPIQKQAETLREKNYNRCTKSKRMQIRKWCISLMVTEWPSVDIRGFIWKAYFNTWPLSITIVKIQAFWGATSSQIQDSKGDILCAPNFTRKSASSFALLGIFVNLVVAFHPPNRSNLLRISLESPPKIQFVVMLETFAAKTFQKTFISPSLLGI